MSLTLLSILCQPNVNINTANEIIYFLWNTIKTLKLSSQLNNHLLQSVIREVKKAPACSNWPPWMLSKQS